MCADLDAVGVEVEVLRRRVGGPDAGGQQQHDDQSDDRERRSLHRCLLEVEAAS
jgi:hypothetical protein